MRVAVLCLLVAACAPTTDAVKAASAPSAVPATQVAGPERVTLSIVGTSDLHGRLGKLPYLATQLTALRSEQPVVLVDAGDAFQGTLESDLDEGETVIKAYIALGYDALAIGNHEFDYGPVGPPTTVSRTSKEPSTDPLARDPKGALKARSVQAKGAFPFLSANLLDTSGCPATGPCTPSRFEWDNLLATTVVVRAGVRVGIIGLSTIETPLTTLSANVRDVKMAPLAQAIVAYAKQLREHERAQVVIVAQHAGGNCKDLSNPLHIESCDKNEEIMPMLAELPRGVVDAIVAGHTHQAMAHEINGIPVIQAYAQGRAYGRVDLTVEGGRVVSRRLFPPQPIGEDSKAASRPAALGRIEPDATVAALIAPALARADAARAVVLDATAMPAPLKKSYERESALGNLVATMMLRAQPQAQLAVMNGGGIRADLPAGPLTYGMLYQALPFDNRFALLKLSGAQVKEMLRRNLQNKGGIVSIAGVSAKAVCKGGELSLEVRRDGSKTPLRDAEALTVVTNDFIATGGDAILPKLDATVLEDERPIREVIAELIRATHPPLKVETYLPPGKPRLAYDGDRPLSCEAPKRP